MTLFFAGRLAAMLGTLGVLAGCSGTYNVGKDPGNGAGSGGSGVGISGAGVSSMSTGGAMPSAGGGMPSAGEAGIGSNDIPSGDAGGMSTSGVAGAATAGGAPGLSYCGVEYTNELAPTFASPGQVWKRLQLFLNPGQTSAPELPAATTRQWAGDLAMSMLDSLGNDSAPGMDRFMSSVLPGTPIASTWAAFFSVKGATLTDLLTTNLVQNPGSGILTDTAVLHPNGLARISIPERGVFVRNHLLCTPAPQPPPGIPALTDAQPGQTRREQLEQVTAAPACAACHALINPLGFGLDHFDIVGAYSFSDNGAPIDSSATLQLSSGTISFDGATQLGAQLANTCEVAQCMAQQMLADAEGSAALPLAPLSIDADSTQPDKVAPIAAAFGASKGDLRTLVRQIVQSDTFLRAP